ncbi:MAG: hypothetical protein JXL84_01465 [Deltaproteobacteria bacterium]|nr:hypothetical protein [Deltaproteobacteria bacterium]
MKVYEGQGVIPNPMVKKGAPKSSGEREFQRIMDQMLPAGEDGNAIGIKGSRELVPEGIQFIGGLEGIHEASGAVKRGQVLEELEQSLDLVDFYAAKLADRSLSVADLEDLVAHMEERVAALRDLESTPGLPERLKGILSETMLTVGTEVARFRRGDYA